MPGYRAKNPKGKPNAIVNEILEMALKLDEKLLEGQEYDVYCEEEVSQATGNVPAKEKYQAVLQKRWKDDSEGDRKGEVVLKSGTWWNWEDTAYATLASKLYKVLEEQDKAKSSTQTLPERSK